MSSELELLQEVALPDDVEVREYPITPGGPTRAFALKRFRDIKDAIEVSKKSEGRKKTLLAMKGKLPVPISDDLHEALKDRIATELVNGKPCVFVTSEEEANMATTIEQGVTDPPMSWAGAVLLCKTNAGIAMRLCKDIVGMLGGEEAIEAAKKGSKTTSKSEASEG